MRDNRKKLWHPGEIRGNKRKQSPIPWLALRMAIFNDCDCKKGQAKARALLADRLYALSIQERSRV